MLDALTSVDGLWNTSRFDLAKLLDDPDHIADNLRAYIHGFSPEALEILDRFEFASQITRLHKAGLLYLVLGKFAEIDLHPDRVSNLEMGYLYEELIRLMVNLLFIEDDDILSKPGAKATLYDPEGPGDQGDQHPNERFDYLLANPPFGAEWKRV